MKQLEEQILSSRGKDPKLMQRLCRELRTRIKMEENKGNEEIRYAQSFADTYLCEAYIQLGKMSEAHKLGLKNMNIQIKENFLGLAVIQSNLLGVIYASEEDFENSSIWFLKSMEFAKQEGNDEIQSTSYFNIAENYYRLGQYEKAKECYEKGYEQALEYVPNERVRQNVIDYYEIHMAYCDLKQQNADLAKERIERVKAFHYQMDQFIINAYISYQKKDYNEAEKYIAAFLRADHKNDQIFELSLKYHDIFELTYDMNKKELAERILRNAYQIAVKIDLPNSYLRFYDDVIKGSKQFDWTDRMDEMYEKYYEWSAKVSDKRKESFLNSLQSQQQIFALQKKEDTLQKKVRKLEKGSHFDELTKLYNRATYEAYVKETLDEAKKEQSYFGYAIMEIKHFKRFNSLLGPEKTNHILQSVAKVVKEAFGEKGRVYRMSGGEFVAVTLKTPTLSYLQSLEKIISDKSLEAIHYMIDGEEEAFGIFIGAINARPSEETLAFEYAQEADRLLHIAKQESNSRYQYQDHLDSK